MTAWDNYNERQRVSGSNKRSAVLKRETRTLINKLKDSMSYFSVTVDINAMGVVSDISTQNVVIIDSDNLDEKYIYSMPGASLTCGSLITWGGSNWIITQLDANSELRSRGMMVQCNHLLKWKDNLGNIISQWAIVDDGTKYMKGIEEDRNFIIERPDARIAVTITRNSNTIKLNRDNRFLVDDSDVLSKMAFKLTKPLRAGSLYNGHGVFTFTMSEVASSEYDNMSLGVADYYSVIPTPNGSSSSGQGSSSQAPSSGSQNQGRWL